jgi:quercetin 2,3-dioxygenase
MISLRRSAEHGLADHGWLESHHTFSFADYHDAARMGFGNLRVINEDRVARLPGFGAHSHRDMEIVSHVLEGGPAHRDSRGNGVRGRSDVNGHALSAGDAAKFSAETTLHLDRGRDAEVLVFDLAPYRD